MSQSMSNANSGNNVHEPLPGSHWLADLNRVAHQLVPSIIHVRRHLHAHPELSMREFATTQFLAQRIEALGLAPQLTPQRIGLTADWQSNHRPGSKLRIGLRGDIDALPIPTLCTGDYASRSAGIMHACGHDAHAAMVWGAVAILQELDRSDALPGPVAVRAIFQPAEETSEGGPLMVAAGALQGVDQVLALHVDPTLAIGTVAGRPGPFTAACDSFEVELIGRSGHSARPHLCVDAIAAAASWIGEMYGRVPRVHDCRDPAVVSVGTIQAGSAPNIVAGSALLTGTIRTFSESARAAIMQEMRNVAAATEKTFGCQVEVNFSAYTPSVHNDPELYQKMLAAARKLEDIHHTQYLELPSMGAEDFAFFAQQRPVCMMRLGIAGPSLGMHALHTSNFDIDERALAIGAQLLAATAIETCVGPPPVTRSAAI
jgi:IAA-amino acid hydrolase